MKHRHDLCALCSSNINEYESTLAEQLIEVVASYKEKFREECRMHDNKDGIYELYRKAGKEEASREISSAFLKILSSHYKKTIKNIERNNIVNAQSVSRPNHEA